MNSSHEFQVMNFQIPVLSPPRLRSPLLQPRGEEDPGSSIEATRSSAR